MATTWCPDETAPRYHMGVQQATGLALGFVKSERGQRLKAFDVLNLEREQALFERIKLIRSSPSPPVVMHVSQTRTVATTDGLGNRLMFVWAGELGQLAKKSTELYYFSVDSAWNNAVLAFARHLDPDTRVILYWH